MTSNYHKDIARHRMAKAYENLSAARVLLQQGLYRDAVSESSYAVFTALRAMLAVFHVDSQRHEGGHRAVS
ncbi:MAG: hypothetical protein C4326_11190 [Ignavibacteria bacterium]|mgnify:CR=1 FL=1